MKWNIFSIIVNGALAILNFYFLTTPEDQWLNILGGTISSITTGFLIWILLKERSSK